ncbi:MAG: preprotein translocase subunit SecE [Campylobacterales bacterium]
MNKLISYIRVSKEELGKVIFPTKPQVRNAFVAVLVVVTIVSLYLGLIDLVMSLTLKSIVG